MTTPSGRLRPPVAPSGEHGRQHRQHARATARCPRRRPARTASEGPSSYSASSVERSSATQAHTDPDTVAAVAADAPDVDVVVVGAGLAGLAAARALVAGGRVGARARGARPRRRAHAERRHRRRRDRRDRRPVGRPDPGPPVRARRRARDRDLPHVHRRRERARAERHASAATRARSRSSTRSPCWTSSARGASWTPLSRTIPRGRALGGARRRAARRHDARQPGSIAGCASARPGAWSRSPPGRSGAPTPAISRCSSRSGTCTPRGGFNPLIDVEGGAQQDRFVGGSQLIALRMAEALGDRVVLGAPVAARSSWGAERRPSSTAGATTGDRAARAIVAMAPPLCAAHRVRARPRPRRDPARTSGCRGARYIKCTAVYDEPFWRADGLSGEGVSDAGPATTTFDNTPPDGSPGVLMSFVSGVRGARSPAPGRLPAPGRRPRGPRAPVRAEGPRIPSGGSSRTGRASRTRGGGPVSFMPPGVRDRLRPRPARARRPDPLGGHRDLRRLVRLHGRRRPLGRTRGGGGPGAPLALCRQVHAGVTAGFGLGVGAPPVAPGFGD